MRLSMSGHKALTAQKPYSGFKRIQVHQKFVLVLCQCVIYLLKQLLMMPNERAILVFDYDWSMS